MISRIPCVDEGDRRGVDPNSNALISQLRDEVAYLRDENRRKDDIIMQQAMTMRQLTAAPPQERSEAREAPGISGPTGELEEVREELGAEQARREMAESTLREGMAEEQRRREEAERERDELRRELVPPGEARESPQTAREEPARAEPRPATGGAQEGVRRPWWRRIIG